MHHRQPELLVRRNRHDEARLLARYGLNTDGSLAGPPGTDYSETW